MERTWNTAGKSFSPEHAVHQWELWHLSVSGHPGPLVAFTAFACKPTLYQLFSACVLLDTESDSYKYSLNVAPRLSLLQARASAGRVTWWRRLRLDDTCLPELAAVMPLPGLESFIGTMYMRYGEESIPPSDLAGWQKVEWAQSLC